MTPVRRIVVAGLGAAIVIGSSLSAPPAGAQCTNPPPQRYTVTLEQHQDGQRTWVEGKGTGLIDLTPLSVLNTGGATPLVSAAIASADGIINTGQTGGNPVNLFYGPITGPTSFGSGAGVTPDWGSGDSVGIYNDTGGSSGHNFLLAVPGPAISGQNDYGNTVEFYTRGTTFSDLGVTPGTYVWCWGSDVGNSLTLVIGATGAAAIPEPRQCLIYSKEGQCLVSRRRKQTGN